MAQNLNRKYDDVTESICYDYAASNCTKYGRLYRWDIAKTMCPDGWHLPTQWEWIKLRDMAETGIGFCRGVYGTNEERSGCELKSKTGWKVYQSYNGGTDVHSFSALPGGYMYGWERAFYGLGETAHFWSSSENGSSGAMYAVMNYNSDNMQIGMDGRDNYFSVRCLQN
jgi:uncharacterized protein (TIGR02145 family)